MILGTGGLTGVIGPGIRGSGDIHIGIRGITGHTIITRIIRRTTADGTEAGAMYIITIIRHTTGTMYITGHVLPEDMTTVPMVRDAP